MGTDLTAIAPHLTANGFRVIVHDKTGTDEYLKECLNSLINAQPELKAVIESDSEFAAFITSTILEQTKAILGPDIREGDIPLNITDTELSVDLEGHNPELLAYIQKLDIAFAGLPPEWLNAIHHNYHLPLLTDDVIPLHIYDGYAPPMKVRDEDTNFGTLGDVRPVWGKLEGADEHSLIDIEMNFSRTTALDFIEKHDIAETLTHEMFELLQSLVAGKYRYPLIEEDRNSGERYGYMLTGSPLMKLAIWMDTTERLGQFYQTGNRMISYDNVDAIAGKHADIMVDEKRDMSIYQVRDTHELGVDLITKQHLNIKPPLGDHTNWSHALNCYDKVLLPIIKLATDNPEACKAAFEALMELEKLTEKTLKSNSTPSGRKWNNILKKGIQADGTVIDENIRDIVIDAYTIAADALKRLAKTSIRDVDECYASAIGGDHMKNLLVAAKPFLVENGLLDRTRPHARVMQAVHQHPHLLEQITNYAIENDPRGGNTTAAKKTLGLSIPEVNRADLEQIAQSTYEAHRRNINLNGRISEE